MVFETFVKGRPTAFLDSPEGKRPRLPADLNPADYVRFVEEAAASVRRPGTRFAVTFLAPDRPGLSADVCRVIADRPLNVEAASEAAVGDLAAMLFIVSSNDTIDVADLQASFEAIGGDRDERVSIAALDPATDMFPREPATQWHLSVRAQDRIGIVADVAEVVAQHGGVLLRMATRLDTEGDRDEYVVDLMFTLTHARAFAHLYQAVVERFRSDGEDCATIRPVDAPTSSILDLPSRRAGLDHCKLLCIVAPARRGLIASVARHLADRGVSVAASSMAILEGRTVAVFAVDSRPTDDELRGALAADVLHSRLLVEVFGHPRAASVPPTGELFKLWVMTHERSGVLAEVSEILAGELFNIERLTSRVLDGNGVACSIQIVLRHDSGGPEVLSRTVVALLKLQDVLDVTLSPLGDRSTDATLW